MMPPGHSFRHPAVSCSEQMMPGEESYAKGLPRPSVLGIPLAFGKEVNSYVFQLPQVSCICRWLITGGRPLPQYISSTVHIPQHSRSTLQALYSVFVYRVGAGLQSVRHFHLDISHACNAYMIRMCLPVAFVSPKRRRCDFLWVLRVLRRYSTQRRKVVLVCCRDHYRAVYYGEGAGQPQPPHPTWS